MTCNRTRGRRILLINQQERRPLFVSKSCFFFDFSGFDAGCEQNAGIWLFWISFQAYLNRHHPMPSCSSGNSFWTVKILCRFNQFIEPDPGLLRLYLPVKLAFEHVHVVYVLPAEEANWGVV